jgi:hypothetical protein
MHPRKRCSRGHDRTDPDNIRTQIRKDGRVIRECLGCYYVRREAYRKGGKIQSTEPVLPLTRMCRWCGKRYGRGRRSPARWAESKYCSNACAKPAFVASGHAARRKPLPKHEVARLRRMVGIA